MRLTKTVVLCSTSVAILAAAASPVWAQTTPGSEAAATAQETPNNPEDVAPQQDDAVQGEEDEGVEVEAVVVTGLRRSLQSAQSIRRNSDQIVDAIVAEDIGKLPDTTASDSLARVTGVQVERGGGEAGRVLVRGLPDITTTYNGRDIFTAEARFVAVQDFPAGGVAALEVYKSSTANLIEPGLAGLINVRSRRPFDFTDREIAGAIRFAYPNQSRDWDANYNILVSDRWQTGMGEIGLLVNFSEQRLHFLDSARFNAGGNATAGPDQVTGTTQPGFRFPDGVGYFQGEGDRRRPSVNASAQWRPSEELQIYADFLYQGFRNEGADRIFFVPLGGGNYSNVVLRPDTNSAQSLRATNLNRPDGFQGAADGATDTYQYAIGAIWNKGPWRLSTDLAHTDSVFDLSIFSFDYALTGGGTVDVNFDVPEDDGGVQFSFVDLDTTDIDNYVVRGFFDRRLVAAGDDIQWRGDAQYETGFTLLPEVEFGLRYVSRNGSFENGERYRNIEGDQIPLSTLTYLDIQENPRGFEGSDISMPRFLVPTRDSIRAAGAQLRALVGFPAGLPPLNPVQEFDANEKSYAAYGQVSYEFDGGIPIDGTIGLRVVRTQIEVTGFSRTTVGNVETFTLRSEESEYTDYLPSITARFRLTDQIQARLAANKTRTRPNFSQLNPGLQVATDPDPALGNPPRRRASGGNIDLQPIESTNYDAALEYYFSPTGSASATVFRRNVEGFIANSDVAVTDPIYGPLLITRPVNLAATEIRGVEAQFTTFFDYGFLPQWTHGFGVQLNGTYIDSELRDISDFSYNVVGMFEQGPVSARLAYNSRSFYRRVDRDPREFVDDVSRLDFSASYTPFDNITLTVDASNILGEPYREFRQFGGDVGTYPADVRYEVSIYSIGMRFRF